MRKLNLKVGQGVVVIYYGQNITRRRDMSSENIDNWCFDAVITSVGKKYIKAEFNGIEETFVIENDYEQKYTCGCPDYKLYLTKEDVYKVRRNEELYAEIKHLFSNWVNTKGYSNEDLEKIADILNAYKNK